MAGYKKTDIWLPQLAGTGNQIRNLTFHECRIYGPCVLYIGRSNFFDTNFTEARRKRAVYIPLPVAAHIEGIVFVSDCLFELCWFSGVGFGQIPGTSVEAGEPPLIFKAPDPGEGQSYPRP